jgi:hypothetical protein
MNAITGSAKRPTKLALRYGSVRLCTKSTQILDGTSEEENVSPAKAQRRKETCRKRGSALRLCAFAGEIFFLYILFVQSQVQFKK